MGQTPLPDRLDDDDLARIERLVLEGFAQILDDDEIDPRETRRYANSLDTFLDECGTTRFERDDFNSESYVRIGDAPDEVRDFWNNFFEDHDE